MVTTYHPGLPDISSIQSEQMREAVHNFPVVSFRNPPNLRKKLVRAKLRTPTIESTDLDLACKPCGDKCCSLGVLLISTSSLRSQKCGMLFHLKARGGTCKSVFCVYYIICPTCNLQYVGSTIKRRTRLNQHK